MAISVLAAAISGAAFVSLGPSGAGAEDDALKQAAIAAAPDVTTALPPVDEPAPDRWTQTGHVGDDTEYTAASAVAAMTLWGDLMRLPLEVTERARVVGDPAEQQRRSTELAARFEETFEARLQRALNGVAVDESYLAYADYELADVTVTYAETYRAPRCVWPCLGNRGFVVFSARQRHQNHDGTWEAGPLQQFQVTLSAKVINDEPLNNLEWRVSKFFAIPLEGEGAEAFVPATPQPIT